MTSATQSNNPWLQAMPARVAQRLHQSWQQVCDMICPQADPTVLNATFIKLCQCYAERSRAYHNLQHVYECLDLLHDHRVWIPQAEEVALALWFHDAIYNVQASDNEWQSACWLSEFLVAVGVSQTSRTRMTNLVMATKAHQAINNDAQQHWLLDIDLAILGSDAARFEQYQQQIRQEYYFVDDAVYAHKRKQVLQHFYERPRLYFHAAMYERFERQAKYNLQQALA